MEESALDAFRKNVSRFLVCYAWIHVPLLGMVAWFDHVDVTRVALSATVLCVIATISWRLNPIGLPTRLANAGVLTGLAALLVYAGTGTWQVDYHMYFFAIFAILATYCDWRPIAFAAILTAAHHLVLDLVLPSAVFPEEGLGRVFLHALIVVVECGILFWMAIRVESLFREADDARRASEHAAAKASAAEREAGVLLVEREKLLNDTNGALDALKFATGQAKLLAAEREELQERLRVEREHELRALVRAFDETVGDVVARLSLSASAMLDVASETTEIVDSSGRHLSHVMDVTRASSTNVQSAAMATNNLARVSEEIGKAVSEATKVAEEAAVEAMRTHKIVSSLNSAAGTIGDVVTLIDELMAQTNLLSLNAAIEAARAGENGRSFAVVAGEMKKLAGRTEEATRQIEGAIGTIATASESAVEAIGAIAGTVERVSDLAGEISESVSHQSNATSEIAKSVGAVAAGTDDVTEAIATLANESEKIGSVTQRVFTAASEINARSIALRDELHRFMESVVA